MQAELPVVEVVPVRTGDAPVIRPVATIGNAA